MAIEGFSEEMTANETLSGFEDNNALGQAHLDLVAEHGKPWKDRLSDDFRKDETNLEAIKGFENFEDMVKAHVEGVKNKPVIPGSPNDYKVPDGEGFKADEKLSKSFREAAHKGGLTQEQADGISSMWNGFLTEVIKEATEAEKTSRETATNSLKDRWKGEKYDQNIESVNKLSGLLAGKLEFSKDDLKDLNDMLAVKPNLARILHFVSGAVSEDAFETSAGPGKPDEKMTGEAFMKEVFDAEKKKEK